jgi:GH15 family glucan-1,4-alpha-glucosidase
MPGPDDYKPIEDYGIIGDLHTVALVGKDGSIDFMCFPEFDSPSLFAALLDSRKGGRFRISPLLEEAGHRQLYLPDTAVLLTRFLSSEGVAEISDFMPVEETGPVHNLVRRAKTVRGEVRFRMICEPRFDYARAAHRVEQRGDEVLFVSEGDDRAAVRLRSSVPMQVRDGAAEAEFTLHSDENAWFVLEEAQPGQESPSAAPDFVADRFKQTVNFWRQWVGRGHYSGRWREMVYRSALTLKLLTSQRHGAPVAAPTFGLPEVLGGQRNWDYRYTWIRDASFSMYALMRLGYTEEAKRFMRWIEARCAELQDGRSLQILYGVDGRREIDEQVLSHLEGYRGSRPVRIGNGAYNQLQLDIYGELMDAAYLCDKHAEPISHDLWRDLVRLIDWVCENWRQKDEGIWEVRGGRREFLYSRLLCWVALDRGIRMMRRGSRPGPILRWIEVRDQIYQDIFESFWDPARQAFVQHKGSKALDAAVLLMPLVRFIGPTDPRWLSTLRALEEALVEDSLVHRYRLGRAAADGLPGQEGTFNMCSFWFAECLARSGDLDQARFQFEKMLGYANHLGLYAEELGSSGQHLGNFPQAFTHIALISTAYDLDRRLSAAGWTA